MKTFQEFLNESKEILTEEASLQESRDNTLIFGNNFSSLDVQLPVGHPAYNIKLGIDLLDDKANMEKYDQIRKNYNNKINQYWSKVEKDINKMLLSAKKEIQKVK